MAKDCVIRLGYCRQWLPWLLSCPTSTRALWCAHGKPVSTEWLIP